VISPAERAHAFNRGADSRLAALPLSSCPCPPGEDERRIAWRQGWRDVDLYWGSWNPSAPPLPPVQEVMS
jgi:hypothetical protein